MFGSEYTQEEIDKNYSKTLMELLKRLENEVNKQNKQFGTKHGFVMMIIRDPSVGNVDVMHNFSKVQDLQNVFEWSLDTIKKENIKNTKGE